MSNGVTINRMKKFQKVTSIPIIAAILLMQGIDIPTDVPREEIEGIVQVLQNSADSIDSAADSENN